LLTHTYLSHGDEAISTRTAFWSIDRDKSERRQNMVAPETDFTADVDANPEAVSPRTKLVWLANPNNPTGTYLPCRRGQGGCAPAYGRRCSLVLDAAYSDYVSRNDYELGTKLVATTRIP